MYGVEMANQVIALKDDMTQSGRGSQNFPVKVPTQETVKNLGNIFTNQATVP